VYEDSQEDPMKPAPILVLFAAAAAAFVGVTAGAGNAEAQYYGHGHGHGRGHVGVAFYPSGLYVGGGLVATRILHQKGGNELLSHGAGINLYGGLRLNPHLALEAGWTGTLHNPARVNTVFGPDVDFLVLNALTADAKVYLDASSPNMEPYIQGGVGLYLLDSEYFGTQSLGTGFQLGGGFDIHLTDFTNLGLRALYRGMAMGPPDAAYNDTFVSALTIDGTITFKF
jgi:hypothetical protein